MKARLRRAAIGAAIAILLLALILAGAVLAIYLQPPELLRAAANHSAKTMCSGVFLQGRDERDVLAQDLRPAGQAPLLPRRLHPYLEISVDRAHKLVRAALFGHFGQGLAVYRAGTGCAAVPDGDLAQASRYHFSPLPIWSPSPYVPWPTGSQAETDDAVQALLRQDALTGAGLRGVAVIHQGRLIAQRYGAGFSAASPLPGGTITSAVTAALVGIEIADGRLTLSQSGFWPDPADPRAAITLAQLMSMTSGLRFSESGGDPSDADRMLYLEPDMAAYSAARPLGHAPGTVWNQASGDALLLSRIWQRAEAAAIAAYFPAAAQAGGANVRTELPAAARAVLALPHNRLFALLGMSSAIIEADARGNLVGSNQMYASTHDWARYGQFLLQDGRWQGKRLLPEGLVDGMRRPAAASGGRYGQGVWLWGPSGAAPPARNPDLAFRLPADTYWLAGQDGQSIAIVPTRQLVVVRLGQTPAQPGYQPQALLAAILEALP